MKHKNKFYFLLLALLLLLLTNRCFFETKIDKKTFLENKTQFDELILCIERTLYPDSSFWISQSSTVDSSKKELIERMKTLDINVINGNSSGNIELIFKPVYSNLFRTKYDVLCYYKNEE